MSVTLSSDYLLYVHKLISFDFSVKIKEAIAGRLLLINS